MSFQTRPLPRIKTPCVSICSVNPATRHCEGCGRNLKEIAQWSRMTDDERAEIVAALPERRKRLEAMLAGQ